MKVKYLIIIIAWITGFVGGNSLSAQQRFIEAEMEVSNLLIGEQTSIKLKLTQGPEDHGIWLIPQDTLMRGVEILNLSKPDTSFIDNRLQIEREMIVTSFDSALYLLPPVRIVFNSDTISSNQLALKVSSVDVDVEHPEQFYDIKSIWNPPFVLADYYLLIYGVLVGLLLICIIGWYWTYRKKKENILEGEAIPDMPPYEEAAMALALVKKEKLWQKEENKKYFTELTDIIRRYLARRFEFDAQEMTTEEILNFVRHKREFEMIERELTELLQLADMVKFAKWKPLQHESELSFNQAVSVVEATKPVIEDTEVQDSESEQEKKGGEL